MQCPTCNATLPDNARFCNACGSPVPQQAACPGCGAEIQPGRKFCMNCGTRLQPEEPAPAMAPPVVEILPEPPRRRALWPVLGVLAALLLIAAAVVTAVVLDLPGRLGQLAGKPPESTESAAGRTPSATPESSPTPPTVTTEVPTPPPGTALAPRWAETQARAAAGAWEEVVAITDELRAADTDFQTEGVSGLRAIACANLARQAEQAPDPAGAQKWWDCVLAEQSADDAALAGRRRAELYLRGQTAAAAQDYENAIAAWESLHAEASGYADVADRLYRAYLANGDLLCAPPPDSERIQKARAQYSAARTLAPEHPEALEKLRLCQLPTPTPTLTPTPLPGPHLAEVTGTDSLRVRTGPGAGYFVLGQLVAGATVTITGRTAGSAWLAIEAGPQRTGWAASEYLKAQYPLEAASVTAPPPLPKNIQVAQAKQDFSKQQGFRDWFYLISTSPGALDFQQMPWDSSTGKWYRWAADGRYNPKMRLSEDGGHPSRQHDVARLWVSPYEGTLHIFGRAYKEWGDGRGGDGVYVRIVHKPAGEQGATTLWEHALGSYDTTGTSFDVVTAAQPGDKLYFITGAYGSDDKDNTIFSPTIELQHADGTDQPQPTRWAEAAGKFATPTPPPPPPAICFEPRLRHYEEHKGCCAEVAGIVYNLQKQPFGPRGTVVRIEGPPATNRYTREFNVDPSGGYNITALSVDVYTIWLKGPNIHCPKFEVKYPDLAKIREIVDFYQVPCK